MKDIYTRIHELVAYNGGLHLAHFMADTKTEEHEVLGELYEKMVDLTDTFVEVYMGQYGVIKFVKGVDLPDLTSKPVTKGLAIVEELDDYFTDEDDEGILNVLAEMDIALYKAKFLLKE